MTRGRALILLLALPLAGAVLGYAAGPYFATAHFQVRLAARVWQEESQQLAERTEESEAYRAKGRPLSELFDQARAVVRRFRTGGALFGAFLGLVVGLKLVAFALPRRREIYEINQADCVACGRCFLFCPREQARRRAGKGEAWDAERQT